MAFRNVPDRQCQAPEYEGVQQAEDEKRPRSWNLPQPITKPEQAQQNREAGQVLVASDHFSRNRLKSPPTSIFQAIGGVKSEKRGQQGPTNCRLGLWPGGDV